MRKALDVTTKGWSTEDISQLTEKVRSQQYRWRGTAVTMEGVKKYFFCYTEVDLADYCYQHGWKLLETKKNDIR